MEIDRKQLRSLIFESYADHIVKHSRVLLKEELNNSDKAEIKRIIKKELEAAAHRKRVEKLFRSNFENSKYVKDGINSEVSKILNNKDTREIVVDICKDVIIKLYRELSFSYKPVIQRLKV